MDLLDDPYKFLIAILPLIISIITAIFVGGMNKSLEKEKSNLQRSLENHKNQLQKDLEDHKSQLQKKLNERKEEREEQVSKRQNQIKIMEIKFNSILDDIKCVKQDIKSKSKQEIYDKIQTFIIELQSNASEIKSYFQNSLEKLDDGLEDNSSLLDRDYFEEINDLLSNLASEVESAKLKIQ